LGLSIDQAADSAHDRRVNRVRAAKTGGNNGPILDPPDAVFDPYPDLVELPIEGLLFLGQLLSFGFLKGHLNRRARCWLLPTRFRVGHTHLADLVGQALIAFVGLGLTASRQALSGLQLIAQLLVMRLAWDGLADGHNVMGAISHDLGFEREAYLFINVLTGHLVQVVVRSTFSPGHPLKDV
jgi:hypothetical protein